VKERNRRVAKPKIPREVLDASQIAIDFIEEPSAPPAEAPPPPRPPSRWAAVARTALGVALVIGLSGTAAFGARRYVTTTPRFAVKDISVAGNARRTAEDVAATAGITAGENVFSLDLEAARARLLADPWIKEAALARRLPATVSITVTERDAAALVALGETYLASRDGEIFKRLEAGDPTDLPVVTGITAEQLADDREGATQTIRRALDLAAEYDHDHPTLAARSPLQEVHVQEGGRFAIVVGKSAVSMQLGAPPFRRKLDEAARVVAELDRRGTKADAILLDNEAHPERVVVRVR
jgi:cell division protein FtsQ